MGRENIYSGGGSLTTPHNLPGRVADTDVQLRREEGGSIARDRTGKADGEFWVSLINSNFDAYYAVKSMLNYIKNKRNLVYTYIRRILLKRGVTCTGFRLERVGERILVFDRRGTRIAGFKINHIKRIDSKNQYKHATEFYKLSNVGHMYNVRKKYSTLILNSSTAQRSGTLKCRGGLIREYIASKTISILSGAPRGLITCMYRFGIARDGGRISATDVAFLKNFYARRFGIKVTYLK